MEKEVAFLPDKIVFIAHGGHRRGSGGAEKAVVNGVVIREGPAADVLEGVPIGDPIRFRGVQPCGGIWNALCDPAGVIERGLLPPLVDMRSEPAGTMMGHERKKFPGIA
jgi:hypothetical protein